jgi:hypothetical protein
MIWGGTWPSGLEWCDVMSKIMKLSPCNGSKLTFRTGLMLIEFSTAFHQSHVTCKWHVKDPCHAVGSVGDDFRKKSAGAERDDC